MFRRCAAVALVVGAVLAQGHDVYKALKRGRYNSPDGAFSVWLPYPGTPETETSQNSASVRTSVCDPRVTFMAFYVDLPDGGRGFDLDAYVASSASQGGYVADVESVMLQGVLGRSWRIGKLDIGAARYDVEYNRAWLVGSRVYRLLIAGSIHGICEVPHMTRSLFLNSFRFGIPSPAHPVPPKADVPYTPPYSNPF